MSATAKPAATNLSTLRFERLDVLRAFAILAVFVFHSLGAALGQDYIDWGTFTRNFEGAKHPGLLVFYGYTLGPLGVMLFFVISGFCIHWSYLRWLWSSRESAPTTKDFVRLFFWKRFWRIYPPYLLALLIWAVAQGYDFTRLHDLKQIVVHALLLHNFDQGHFYAICGAFWSLAVEMQLYLIYPLVIILHRRFNVWAIVGLIVFAAALKESPLISSIDHPRIRFAIGQLPIFYWPQWLIGALAAELVVRKIMPNRNWGIALLIGACIYLPASQQIELARWSVYLVFILFGMVVWMAASDQRPLGLLEQLLAPIGICSYSLYMYHGFAIHEFPFRLINSPVATWSPWWELTYGTLFGLACTLAFSWLSYRYTEKTSEKFGADLLKRLRAKPTRSAPPVLTS
jgi:peptidoglycan/LPS O-acetylase OafA/YrhL